MIWLGRRGWKWDWGMMGNEGKSTNVIRDDSRREAGSERQLIVIDNN